MLRLDYDEVPVAYSMITLVKKSNGNQFQPFQEYLCYWAAFNSIYTTLANKAGIRPTYRVMENGMPRMRKLWNYYFPIVNTPPELDQIDEAIKQLSPDIRKTLISSAHTAFFVNRVPRGVRSERDHRGQRINGVLNITRTVDLLYPIWSPIDIDVYEAYLKGNHSEENEFILTDQIINLLYTVRNNLVHGGKRADDANDRKVVENALPLLKLVVESFLDQPHNVRQ